MSSSRSLCFVALIAFVALLHAAPPAAAEQSPDDGLYREASFTAGASFGDGDTALAMSGALGFGLLPRLAIELELAYGRRLDFTLDYEPPPDTGMVGGQVPVTGRTVSLVPHVRVELGPVRGPLRVYAVAGIGAGQVRQRYVIGPATVQGAGSAVEFTRSNVVGALSFGGGMSVALTRRLLLGADVRSLHLFDDEAAVEQRILPAGHLVTLRAGARVSWRF